VTNKQRLLAAPLMALPLAVPTGAALAAHAADAQVAQHRGNHFMRGAPCHFRGARISRRDVRRHARRRGFRRIHNIRFVPRRHGRYNWCGFYRAEAMFRGRPFVIFADSHTGRIIGRHRRGRGRGHVGRSYRRDLSVGQVRRMLRRQGYRRIRNVRYVRRNGRDFYMARAHWRGWVVRLRINDETGRIVNRRRLRRLSFDLKTPDLSHSQVRALLRSKGYRAIRDVRYEQTANAADYIAIAKFDSARYRVRVDGTTGRLEGERRLR
jgi:hypothetical protein